ncbi:MAG: LamG domain-containing protein, partial [bacterium]
LIISIIIFILIFTPYVSDASLVAYWPFGEGSGKLLKDYSGKNNNGQIVGSPKWVKGRSGKAIEFNGIDDFIVVSNNDSINFGKNDSFTISLWIKYTPKGDWQGILQKFDGSYAFDIGIQPDNALYFAISDGVNISKLVIGNVSGQWHHCCFIRNTRIENLIANIDTKVQSDLDNSIVSEQLRNELSSRGINLSDDASIYVKEKENEWQITSNKQTYKIRKEGETLNIYTSAIYAYLDGKLIGKIEDKTSEEIKNKSNLFIGARNPGNVMLFSGLLDELAIYDHVFTDIEIKNALKGKLPEVYKESSIRRFEIIFTSSIPFTAIHSYLVVRGAEMAIQRRVSPKLDNSDWNAIGAMTVGLSGLVGFWDWWNTSGEDNLEIIKPQRNRYDYPMYYSINKDFKFLSLAMNF